MNKSLPERRRIRIFLIILVVSLLATTLTRWAQAQVQGDWTDPFRLSVAGRRASEAFLVSDQYGFVHTFWEEQFEENRSLLMYSRFDGDNWSLPIDIRILVPFGSLQTASPIVDVQGMLHLIWSEGNSGPVFYSRAQAHETLSAQNWQKPIRIPIDAKRVLLQVDDAGVLHILYSKVIGQEPGVFYRSSEDLGLTWSDAIWLDPDIKPNFIPGTLQFSRDTYGNLHALWYYARVDIVGADWIRYSRSTNDGITWEQPRTVAQDEVSGTLNSASPVMITADDDVHIVWAQGELFYRQHSYSLDAGKTWSEPIQFMGDLNGQAFESLAVDGRGYVHFMGQIRYPQGIYHSWWDGDAWTEPDLVYLISRDSDDPIGDRIHAHHTHSAVRAGNQLVLTFADSPPEPSRRLFSMTYTLEDVPILAREPTPTAFETPELLPTSTRLPPPSPTSPNLAGADDQSDAPAPGLGLWSGVIPAAAVLGAVFLALVFLKNRF